LKNNLAYGVVFLTFTRGKKLTDIIPGTQFDKRRNTWWVRKKARDSLTMRGGTKKNNYKNLAKSGPNGERYPTENKIKVKRVGRNRKGMGEWSSTRGPDHSKINQNGKPVRSEEKVTPVGKLCNKSSGGEHGSTKRQKVDANPI